MCVCAVIFLTISLISGFDVDADADSLVPSLRKVIMYGFFNFNTVRL